MATLHLVRFGHRIMGKSDTLPNVVWILGGGAMLLWGLSVQSPLIAVLGFVAMLLAPAISNWVTIAARQWHANHTVGLFHRLKALEIALHEQKQENNRLKGELREADRRAEELKNQPEHAN